MSDHKINAKEELLDATINYKIIAASITFGDSYDEEDNYTYKLKPGYSKDEYVQFIKFMDRKYDSGYGGQELFGIIYCENNIWLDRFEYDGSECWQTHKYPDFRENFDEIDVLKYERCVKLSQINKQDDII